MNVSYSTYLGYLLKYYPQSYPQNLWKTFEAIKLYSFLIQVDHL